MSNNPGSGFYIFILIFLFSSFVVRAAGNRDTTYYEIWHIDTLENIGGHLTEIIGNPEVITTDDGKAVKFDGDGDMLLINANPLADTKEFTIEIIFKPDGAYPQNTDPRFLHIQDPEDTEAKRVMIELRLTADNLWYLDGFMNTDNASLTLVNESLTHPTGQWMHAAVTYQNSLFKTWVNGIEELNGNVTYASAIVAPDAKTSLGARMNRKNWYSGIIKALRVTHRVLDPAEFLTTEANPSRPDEFMETGPAIYPNPANQHITFSAYSTASMCFIKIINLTGRTIYQEQWIPAQKSAHYINTSGFPEGIYLIEFFTDKNCQTKKLMIIP